MYKSESIEKCSFYKRNNVCIVFENDTDRKRVIEFLEAHDPFEHEYFTEDIFVVGDLNEFKSKTNYVGKYEPDLEAVLEFCNTENIKFVVYNETRGVYFSNKEVDVEYDLYETLHEFYNQVTSIRGIDIEDGYCIDICDKVREVLKKYKK